ncbi:uncharacterized protein LOC124386150, partial [Tachysurus ichikawai]
MSVAEGESARVLTAKIETLLSKQAIRVVHGEESRQGFYSRYFVVPKKGSTALRSILDLHILNRHLRKVLCRSIRPSDWKFLRFAYWGTAYEFQTIPFGLSLAPRVFTKCVEAALFPLRGRGIRILSYIDDYLICLSSREQAIRDAEIVLNHLRDLGFRINMIKSRLVPSQQTEYLGINLNPSFVSSHIDGRENSIFHTVSPSFSEGTSGPVQAVLTNAGAYGFSDHCSTFGATQDEGFSALDHAFVRSGIPLGAVSSRVTMTTDTSLKGWGATLMGRAVNGTWPPQLMHKHINYLELLAVWLALKHFLSFLKGRHVVVETDNSTVVAYINRQGGTCSLQLHRLAK